MENTPRPTIIIHTYDINAINNTYKPLITLTHQDQIYLNIWREKARKLYKKYNGIYTEVDETYLIDPDPFECKWFIFRIKPMSRRATQPSPCLTVISSNNNDVDLINHDLLDKFILNP
jgi:hypothetical protein